MMPCEVLIVEDDLELGQALLETLALEGHHAEWVRSGQEAIKSLSKHSKHLVLTDVQMSGMNGHQLLDEIQCQYPHIPVVLMTAYGTIDKAVNALQQGALDYLVKPFDIAQLEQLLQVITGCMPVDIMPIAVDPSTQQLYAMAKKVAITDSSVFISGESGTGKEVLARFIHEHSDRSKKPFVAINCAAIPDNMLEATLFGYEKGAFTGAVQASMGKFEQAQGGSLLLDEITEMPLALQAKLLRVLQEHEVEPLGSRRMIRLDVRVIATSNRNLQEAVAHHEFREDLYYRLNVFPLHCQSLRNRALDVLPLAKYLLNHHAKKMNKEGVFLSGHALYKLQQYPWPGNVREMDNVLQRALILQQGKKIRASDLVSDAPISLHIQKRSLVTKELTAEKKSEAVTLGEDMKFHELQKIIAALQFGISKKEAAERLGISPRTLRYKIARLRAMGYDVDSMNPLSEG